MPKLLNKQNNRKFALYIDKINMVNQKAVVAVVAVVVFSSGFAGQPPALNGIKDAEAAKIDFTLYIDKINMTLACIVGHS